MSHADEKAALPGLGPRTGVPRLSPNANWGALSLDDVQGFVLSRIDGRTTLAEIVLLSPMPEAQTASILKELFAIGVIDVPGVTRPASSWKSAPPMRAPAVTPRRGVVPAPNTEPPPKPRTAIVPSPPPPPPQARATTPRTPVVPPPSLLARPPAPQSVVVTPPPVDTRAAPERPAPPPADDAPKPGHALPPELRARIDAVYALLADDGSARDPHRLLGIEVGSDRRTVKRAYFRLSKEFHPDRYFNKDLGDEKRRLLRVWNALNEAYEALYGDGASRK
jgi:hypothetical protein